MKACTFAFVARSVYEMLKLSSINTLPAYWPTYDATRNTVIQLILLYAGNVRCYSVSSSFNNECLGMSFKMKADHANTFELTNFEQR